MQTSRRPRGDDSRVILHIDYDAFYATVVELSNPSLRSLPLAIQQKQIIATCNYEARRRGLRKLQPLVEARRLCPDLVVVSGENLDRFRAASLANFELLASFVAGWGGRAERLGFDEVWLDATEAVCWNLERWLLGETRQEAGRARFDTDRDGGGFWFDPGQFAGHVWPRGAATAPAPLLALLQPAADPRAAEATVLDARLQLGSHLAAHVRAALEEVHGYTATAGVAVNKTLAKLVGAVHKPAAQTTLMGPVFTGAEAPFLAVDPPPAVKDARWAGPPAFDTALAFMSLHDVARIPGLGFRTAGALRAHMRGTAPPGPPTSNPVYGFDDEPLLAGAVRTAPGMGARKLGSLLARKGAPRDAGERAWALLHGVDGAAVAAARFVPRQISIEDSYTRLTDPCLARAELARLATRLVLRMRADLRRRGRWVAWPRTVRVSVRERVEGAWGAHRASRQAAMPPFVFGDGAEEDLAERLVAEVLMGLFGGVVGATWDLAVLNVCAAGIERAGGGGDIRALFGGVGGQGGEDAVGGDGDGEEMVLLGGEADDGEGTMTDAHGLDVVGDLDGHRDVFDCEKPGPVAEHVGGPAEQPPLCGSEDFLLSQASTSTFDDDADAEQPWTAALMACARCGASMPLFAHEAHQRFHESPS